MTRDQRRLLQEASDTLAEAESILRKHKLNKDQQKMLAEIIRKANQNLYLLLKPGAKLV